MSSEEGWAKYVASERARLSSSHASDILEMGKALLADAEEIEKLRKQLGSAYQSYKMLLSGEIMPLNDTFVGVIKGAFVGVDWTGAIEPTG